MSRDIEHAVYEEWLHLEPDGGLTTAERARLHRHLLSCAECRRESEELPELFGLLDGSKVPVEEGFGERVMSALPAAGWQARRPRSWSVAAALLVALLGLSATLVSIDGAGGVESALPIGGALLAIVELFRSTLLAGAGLSTASWQGLGMAVGELLHGSPVNTAVFALFVLGIDFLFIRLLMRTARARAHDGAAASRSRSGRGAG